MSTVLSIFGFVFVTLFIVIVLVCLIIVHQYLCSFYFHRCKHCGNYMNYKGLKENEKESHYLFHCSHCGSWEQIPKEVFLRNCDKNPIEE